jgi:hypothetical protein
MITERSHRNKHLCIAFLLTLSCTASAAELKVVQISENPDAYHRQKVSVKGVAFVQGKSFILFQDPRAAKEYAGPPKSLPVTSRDDAPTYENDKYNDCWVKITAIVDANRHGRWHFPCELLLEKVEPISGPIVIRRTTYAVFRNQTSQAVEVRLFNPSGKYARFVVGPGGVEGFPAQNGRVEVTTAGGKALVAEAPIDVNAKPRIGAGVQTLYFQIQDRRIETASDEAARGWHWRP